MVPYFGWCYIFWVCSTLWVNPCISWSTSYCRTYPTSYYPSSTYGVCLTWDHYNYPFRRPSHFTTYLDMSLSSTTQYCACPDTYSWWWHSKFSVATFPNSIVDLSIVIQKGIHPTQNHSPFHINCVIVVFLHCIILACLLLLYKNKSPGKCLIPPWVETSNHWWHVCSPNQRYLGTGSSTRREVFSKLSYFIEWKLALIARLIDLTLIWQLRD